MSVHEPRRRSRGWGRPGSREGRERGAGPRRPSLKRLASRFRRLASQRLSDRHARIREAPVGREARPVGPAAPPRLRRGHRGGPSSAAAPASGAPALRDSCFPPLHPGFGLAGSVEDCAPGDVPGQTLSGRQLTFPRAVPGARLSAFGGRRAPTPAPCLELRGGEGGEGRPPPCLRWQVLGSSRPPPPVPPAASGDPV